MPAPRRITRLIDSDSSTGVGGPVRRGVLAVSVTAVALVGLAACSSGSKSTAASSSAAASSTSSAATPSTTSAAPTSAAATSAAATSAAVTKAAATSAAVTKAAAPASKSSAPAAAAIVMIKDFKYQVPASVKPGATVQVMNMDSEAHTVTADKDKAFDDMATPGKVTTFTAPTKPGSYPFHCTYHSNMHGVLVVK